MGRSTKTPSSSGENEEQIAIRWLRNVAGHVRMTTSDRREHIARAETDGRALMKFYRQLYDRGLPATEMVPQVSEWLAEHGYRTDFGVWKEPDYEAPVESGGRTWSLDAILR